MTGWGALHASELDSLVQGVAAIKSGNAAPKKAPAAPESAEKKPVPKKAAPDKNKQMADSSMLDLFRIEVTEQGNVLMDGLLALEENPAATDRLEALIRAAQSIKGAARLGGGDP